jgi:hypothetical protein
MIIEAIKVGVEGNCQITHGHSMLGKVKTVKIVKIIIIMIEEYNGG